LLIIFVAMIDKERVSPKQIIRYCLWLRLFILLMGFAGTAVRARFTEVQSGEGRTTVNSGLAVASNYRFGITGKNYGSGALSDTFSLNSDGSLAGETISGSGGSATTAVTQTPTLESTTYADGTTLATQFYNVGLPSAQSGPNDGRSFSYQNLQLQTETHTAGPWLGWAVGRQQDTQGRLGTITISQNGTVQRSFTYAYDGNSRLSGVSTNDGVAWATYARNGLGQVNGINRGEINSTIIYDGTSGLLSSVGQANAGGTSFNYTYGQYDPQRRMVTRTASPGVSWNSMTYDSQNELTGANLSTGQAVAYSYNSRGNRVSQGPGGVAQTPNGLDQITGRRIAIRGFGLVGSVTPSAQVAVQTSRLAPAWQSLNVNSSGDFSASWTVPSNFNGGAAGVITGTVVGTLPGGGTNGATAEAQTSMRWMAPPTQENLAYDFQGRLTGDAFWTYTWDGPGRLTQMVRKAGTFTEAGETSETVVFTYDTQGRRTSKTWTVTYAGTTTKVEYSQVLWSGWLPVLEMRSVNGQSVGWRWFEWGADRSGTLDGAGGIGGLVAIIEQANGGVVRTLLPVDDGLGNITAVVNAATGQTVARYDYGPFGETLGGSGEVSACPFRYQSKWYDAESGHYNFGVRYYDPRLGRWLSRDPMGESGGFNLASLKE
jgi:RHS repeat-associated protein